MTAEHGDSVRPLAHQAQPHQTPPETWTLTLNRYQRDNLLNLLQCVMEGDERSASWFNSGDWVGEIRWMLGRKFYGYPGLPAEPSYSIDSFDRPNPVPESS